MDDTTLHNESRFLRYLPGIYQEQPDRQGEPPLRALLAIFEGLIDRIEQGIGDTPAQFDPYAARPEFLDWLASWVALPLDDEWEAENQRVRKSYLISHAAELYRLRGTATGLKYMLSAFHDLDTEVLEWTWPASMQIGVTSTVGVDCMIMDRPNLRSCFVLVVQLDQVQRDAVAEFVDLIPTALVRHEDTSVSTPLLRAKQAGGEWFIRRFEKIRYLIDNEKPAHSRCYVVIKESRPTRTRARIEAMTIGVHSTIGSCTIA